MIRSHLDAIIALLEPLTAPAIGCRVYDGEIDDAGQEPTARPPATPYVVVRSDSMPLASDRLAQYSSVLQGRIYVTCVGKSRAEAQWAQERTRALLLDVRPAVTGRQVSPLALDDGEPITTDRDTNPPTFYAVDVYRLTSLPGPTT